MIGVTLKGIIRDRVFRGILMASLFFLAVPTISTLSMRQVTELSLTLCLSLVSFLLLLLAIFQGGILLWRDIERRYAFSVLTLPMSRTRYLLGRFFGVALFLFLAAAILGFFSAVVVFFVSLGYPPDRPVAWGAVAAAIIFDTFKCILLVAFSAFFSSFSTSFFLPVFGTIAIYLVGGASQQAYDYVHSVVGQSIGPLVRQLTSILYYLLPNFSAFDFKVNAIYAVSLDLMGMGITFVYFFVYTAVLLTLAATLFSKRELG